MQAKGYATHGENEELKPFLIERRQTSESDIQIKIEYCGICHSDIHQARNQWRNAIYPMVPGHEIVGVVTEVGSNAKMFKVGDRVGIGCLVNSCRNCSSCNEGLEQFCEGGVTLTYNGYEKDGKTLTFGGYSDLIVCNEDFALKIPENLDPASASPLLCAGITTYSPLKYVGVKPGDKVAINGFGGLGHMGVKIASAMGAEVTVLSHSPSKKEDAIKFGASHFVNSKDEQDMAKRINYFDFILNTVSAKHDFSQLLNSLKRDGTMMLVGLADKPIDLTPFPLILRRRKILGSLIGGIKETQEMLDFCGNHYITSTIELIEPKDINNAYERILVSDVKYRFVIDCQKF